MNRHFLCNCVLSIIFILIITSCREQLSETLIWSDKQATYFEEAFPLGNGFEGVMVKGGAPAEDLILNDSTLWAGGPVDANMNPEAWKNLDGVRKALFSEDYRLAEKLVRKMQGSYSASYAPLGNLMINFSHGDSVSDYRRTLDLSTGLATVTYSAGNNLYLREMFVSNPDRVAVIYLRASRPGSLEFSVSSGSKLVHDVHTDKGDLIMDGIAPVHADPNYVRNNPNPVIFDTTGKGMRFRMIVRVLKTDGETGNEGKAIKVSGATDAVLLLSMATSFNGPFNDPGLNGVDEKALAEGYISKASSMPYDDLKNRHLNDFTSLFNRVSLSLNNSQAPDLPIYRRLMNYTDSMPDYSLEALYFQFGRYLLISSSRPGGIPANLQGLWNPHLRPPWSSNYTANINSEMNYWPAEVTNLSETHKPLLDFIGKLPVTGQVTARTFYNCEGWCCSHNTDLWAMTNPVGNFGDGDPVWANWSMAGAWYSLHLYDHFAFSCDTAWLQDYAWPLIKGAAQFCLDYLVENPEGYLVTAPSTSPENKYKMPDGFIGATSYGGTSDNALIRGLFNKVISASAVLNSDREFADEVKRALDKMYPYKTGKMGNLQEWYHDWEDSDPEHRHISHLIGLYPDNQIAPLTTPELAAAAKRTLELRGDGGTGWSKAWKINTWARLLDGDHAYRMLRTHLHYVSPSPDTRYSGGGTYPNLFDAHPPFQIDGNFGGTSGIAEMLLQSHLGEIHLLPALPEAWKDGEVNGLRARGAYTIGEKWENGKLTQAIIAADYSGTVRVRYGDKVISLVVTKGQITKVSPEMFK